MDADLHDIQISTIYRSHLLLLLLWQPSRLQQQRLLLWTALAAVQLAFCPTICQARHSTAFCCC
jgi:hypothetical protein